MKLTDANLDRVMATALLYDAGDVVRQELAGLAVGALVSIGPEGCFAELTVTDPARPEAQRRRFELVLREVPDEAAAGA